jgi:hypothetical protein
MANNLWTAFIADNGSNDILAASLPEGGAWTSSAPIYQTSPFSPALAYFGDALYVAFITDDEDSATGVPSNRIFLCRTKDGVSWSEAIFFHQYSKCAPSLAVWNGSLHIAFVANDPHDALLVYHSSNPTDPSSWSATVDTHQTSALAPSLAAYPASGPDSKLYMAFVAENGSQEIFVCSLAVNGQWTMGPSTGQTCHFSPSLTAGDNLYLAFAAQNTSKDLYLCSLKADGSWAAAVPVNQSTSATPCVVDFGSGLSIGFAADDPGGQVLIASTTNPALWNSGDVYTRQQSAAGPALAVTPFGYAPVSPGPSAGSARINYLITNHNIVDPLQNITVTVVAIQDLINTDTYNGKNYEPVGSPITPGFSFQLNCQPPGTIPGTGTYPAKGQNVWGQYGIAVRESELSMWYENSLNGGLGPVESQNLFTLPKTSTIPKGYKIEIKLETDASTNNVKTLSVNAWDENGNPIKGGPGSSPVEGPWTLQCTKNPAPMLNLQFNIGGPDNGQYAKFAAGSESFPLITVSYQADSPLMVRGATNPETAESSNLTFGRLSEYPSNPILQVGYVS